MTHDPLCYLYREDGEFNLMADRCVNCRLIAKVRADERDNCWAAVAEIDASELLSDGRWWVVKSDALATIESLGDLIAKVRADERAHKGTCWREANNCADESTKVTSHAM